MTVKRRNHGRSKPPGARGHVKRVRAPRTGGSTPCSARRPGITWSKKSSSFIKI